MSQRHDHAFYQGIPPAQFLCWQAVTSKTSSTVVTASHGPVRCDWKQRKAWNASKHESSSQRLQSEWAWT